jgi:hypothetical protein
MSLYNLITYFHSLFHLLYASSFEIGANFKLWKSPSDQIFLYFQRDSSPHRVIDDNRDDDAEKICLIKIDPDLFTHQLIDWLVSLNNRWLFVALTFGGIAVGKSNMLLTFNVSCACKFHFVYGSFLDNFGNFSSLFLRVWLFFGRLTKPYIKIYFYMESKIV